MRIGPPCVSIQTQDLLTFLSFQWPPIMRLGGYRHLPYLWESSFGIPWINQGSGLPKALYFQVLSSLLIFMFFVYFSGSRRGSGILKMILKGQLQNGNLITVSLLSLFESKNQFGCSASVIVRLLRDKARSFEHTKHASPGPLHNSSHCWAGPGLRCSRSLSPFHSVLWLGVPSLEGTVVSTLAIFCLALFLFLNTFHSLTLYYVCICLLFAFPLSRNKLQEGRDIICQLPQNCVWHIGGSVSICEYSDL